MQLSSVDDDLSESVSTTLDIISILDWYLEVDGFISFPQTQNHPAFFVLLWIVTR